MKTVQMISANGGAEIEVNDDRVEHFERKGWRLVDAKAPRQRRWPSPLPVSKTANQPAQWGN